MKQGPQENHKTDGASAKDRDILHQTRAADVQGHHRQPLHKQQGHQIQAARTATGSQVIQTRSLCYKHPEPIIPVMTNAVNVVRPKPSGAVFFDKEPMLLSTKYKCFIMLLNHPEQGGQQKMMSGIYKLQNLHMNLKGYPEAFENFMVNSLPTYS